MIDNNGMITKQVIISPSNHIRKCNRLSSIKSFFELDIGIPIDINRSFLELIHSRSPTNSGTSWISLKSKQLYQLNSYLIKYFRGLVNDVNLKLIEKKIDLEKVGYVLCMDKLLMGTFYISSRTKLLKLMKENNIVNFSENPRKMIIVDQGEKIAWNMVRKNYPEPSSYYVQANVSDNHIYLKLSQVIDTTASNGGIPETSTIYIKDTMITIENAYEQVAEILWNHIHSLDDSELKAFLPGHRNNKQLYSLYKKKLKVLFTQEVKLIIIQGNSYIYTQYL